MITVDAKWGANHRGVPDYEMISSPEKYYELSPFLAKELLHQLAALFLKNAPCYCCLGVHGMWGIRVEAPFLVGTAIDNAGKLCPANGTGTHGARLHGDIKRAVCEVFAS